MVCCLPLVRCRLVQARWARWFVRGEWLRLSIYDGGAKENRAKKGPPVTQPNYPQALVVGSPIGHSLSPVLHRAGYRAAGLDHWSYDRVECSAEEFAGLLEKLPGNTRGLSVTMPCKFAALAFADEASERAQLIGAANTLTRTPGGWHADNTDVEGMIGAVEELFGGKQAAREALSDAPAVVVGAGGTARPTLVALASFGVREIFMLNRTRREEEFAALAQALNVTLRWWELAGIHEELQRASVVVSTVPSKALDGYVDELAVAPIVDVIYDPWPTPLIERAKERGLPAVGGHVMLACQAYTQFAHFTGVEAPRQAMRSALERCLGLDADAR